MTRTFLEWSEPPPKGNGQKTEDPEVQALIDIFADLKVRPNAWAQIAEDEDKGFASKARALVRSRRLPVELTTRKTGPLRMSVWARWVEPPRP